MKLTIVGALICKGFFLSLGHVCWQSNAQVCPMNHLPLGNEIEHSITSTVFPGRICALYEQHLEGFLIATLHSMEQKAKISLKNNHTSKSEISYTNFP